MASGLVLKGIGAPASIALMVLDGLGALPDEGEPDPGDSTAGWRRVVIWRRRRA